MDKHQAYRKRCKEDGRCPHCGKPCQPFADCAERRAYKALRAKERSAFNRSSPPMQNLPRGKRRLWTAMEDRKLRNMLMYGTSFKFIHLNLNRTPWAIVARARRLGISKFNELQPLLNALQIGILE